MTARVRQTLQMVIPTPYAEPEYMGVDDDHGDYYASFRMVELREGEEIVTSAEIATLRAQLAGVREKVEGLTRYDLGGYCEGENGCGAMIESDDDGFYLCRADVLAALDGAA